MENFPKEDFPWENDLQDLKASGKTSTYLKYDGKL